MPGQVQQADHDVWVLPGSPEGRGKASWGGQIALDAQAYQPLLEIEGARYHLLVVCAPVLLPLSVL